MALQPGDLLNEKYRLESIIGRGGMGEVFAASDLTSPGREVAVKVVRRTVVDDVVVARLHREVAAASRIRSDYVPRVLDVAETAEGEFYFVMDRLVGESLSERLRARGPLAWEEVERIGGDVLRGLIDAHTAGIVHRDLKPSNVFLTTKDGVTRAMVLDFGICKMEASDTEHLTSTGEAIGTVAYMAPEQIRAASQVDDRADLYAFGVLVFEMMSRKLPHEGTSQMAILASKLERPAARLRDHAEVPLPEGLDTLVANVLSRNPTERFPSAQALLKAWRTLGSGDPNATSSRTAWSATSSKVSFVVPRGQGGAADLEETAREIQNSVVETSFTAGLAFGRVGRRGRIAYALAGVGLLFGIVATAVAFLRPPSTSTDARAVPAAVQAAPPVAPRDVVEAAPREPTEIVELPDLVSPVPVPVADAGVAQPARRVRRPRHVRPPVKPRSAPAPSTAAATSAEPRIITRPRY